MTLFFFVCVCVSLSLSRLVWAALDRFGGRVVTVRLELAALVLGLIA